MVVHKNYYQDSRVRRYVESLIKTDSMVDVICLSDLASPAGEAHERIRVYSIPVRHVNKSRIRYVFEYIYAFVLFLVRLSFLQLKNHYQIVHVHNMPDFLIFSALIPKIMGARLILDIHDPMPEVFVSKYGERSSELMVNLLSFEEKISCAFANAIITVNIKCKSNLIKRGIPSEKITLIHNYPDPAIFNRAAYAQERQRPREKFTLIYPGTIAPRYGLEIAIRALPEIQSQIPEISLIIMGPKNEYRNELQQLADQQGVSSCVQFKPSVSPQEVPCYLAMADIGIYPALKDVHMNVATPTKVLEFAAMGIPIISSRLSMVEEMFGNSAVMFFEPGDATQFAQCVISLHENQMLGEELVKNMDQIFIAKHSWQQEFGDYLHIVNQLLPDAVELKVVNNDGKELGAKALLE
jgi:glycosyltransferase involved in cell wall biosynthesis